jgi:uncharacterized membrane protein YagU involved in acid resistance
MMGSLVAGALAGLVATAPMSLAMEALHDRLPFHHRHPLPPRRIVDRALGRIGLRADDEERGTLTVVGHFGYGAATGAVYGALSGALRPPPMPAGIAFGMVVWAVSYLAMLPLVGLFRRPEHEAGERKALMIAAHAVWGAVLGLLADRLGNSADRRA